MVLKVAIALAVAVASVAKKWWGSGGSSRCVVLADMDVTVDA